MVCCGQNLIVLLLIIYRDMVQLYWMWLQYKSLHFSHNHLIFVLLRTLCHCGTYHFNFPACKVIKYVPPRVNTLGGRYNYMHIFENQPYYKMCTAFDNIVKCGTHLIIGLVLFQNGYLIGYITQVICIIFHKQVCLVFLSFLPIVL